MEKAALGAARFQSEADYHTPKGLKLKDDYSRAFQIASAQWKHFAGQFERSDVDADALTRHFVQELLRDAFGYTHIAPVTGLSVGDQHYPVTFLAGALPVVVAPHTLGLDVANPRFAVTGNGHARKSRSSWRRSFSTPAPTTPGPWSATVANCVCCATPPRSPAPAFWKSICKTYSVAHATPSSPTSGACCTPAAPRNPRSIPKAANRKFPASGNSGAQPGRKKALGSAKVCAKALPKPC
ncbi:hypothetical protein AFERRI_560028 [Acidithiobacillus ferrivorans]|uniref:Uncharacterized protein n=1 Tax=Acidithiobacillus ferrivorans TaxID=160808 RepID=A0A060UMH3_9PROT|nr:hypothetical protein AFERRI_30316 [Acidithiobacillus ferrivorans]CDQ11479.1 hypothetical protein AFERRI_560028 [Acidithiobacillus ferrivorans]